MGTECAGGAHGRKRKKGRAKMYAQRFWKKNWDAGLEDLKPAEFETTYRPVTARFGPKIPRSPD
jgi:hypothetical protein